MRDVLLTAITPVIWGTTYYVTTEFLPANRPLTTAALRALPIGLLLLIVFRQLPQGVWRFRAAILGALNIGFFFALLFISAYRLPGGVGCGRRDSTFSSRFFSVFSARGKFDVAENIGGDSGHRWRVFNRAKAFGTS